MPDQDKALPLARRVGIERILDAFPLTLLSRDDDVHVRKHGGSVERRRALHQRAACDGRLRIADDPNHRQLQPLLDIPCDVTECDPRQIIDPRFGLARVFSHPIAWASPTEVMSG